MTDTVTFERFVRTPFVVEAVVITEANIDEIASRIGEVKVEKGKKYIAIDRRVVRYVGRADLGWYFTEFQDSYRCYAPEVFEAQFIQVPETGLISFDVSSDDGEPHPELEFEVVPAEPIVLEIDVS